MNGVLNIQVRVLSREAQAQLKQLEREIAAVDAALEGQGGATRQLTIAQEHNRNTVKQLTAANRELAAAQKAVVASAKAEAAAQKNITATENAYRQALMSSAQALQARKAAAASAPAASAARANAAQKEIEASRALRKAKLSEIDAQLAYDRAQERATAQGSQPNIDAEERALRRLQKAQISVASATDKLAAARSTSVQSEAAEARAVDNLAAKELALTRAKERAAAAARAVSAAHEAAAAAASSSAAADERLIAAERALTAAQEAEVVSAEAVIRAQQQATAAKAASAAASAEAAAAAKAAAAETALANKAAASSTAALAGAAGGLAVAGNNMRKFGSQTQWAGRQLQTNFTLPVMLAGGLATKWALENEQAMTRVAKVYGELDLNSDQKIAELEALGRAFEALSNHFGVQQKEVLNIAAEWAAAGAAGRGLAEGVKNTLETMVLGEIDAAKATKALIAIQAQYDLNTQQLSQTIGELNIIENQTGASLGDLIDGFSRAAGMANLVGVDTRHLGAMIAALTPAAGSAANAGNGLKTVFARLVAPTKEAREILHAVGLETDALAWKNANATQKLEAINKAYYEHSKAERGVIAQTLAGTYQVSRFAELMDSMHGEVVNGTKQLSQYQKALKATADVGAYMDQKVRELNTVLESNPQKLKQVWVVLQNTLARAIIPAIPAIIMMAGMIQRLFEKFQELPPYVRKAILAFVLFAAVMGPILRVVGSFVLLGGYVAKVFFGMRVAAKALGKVFQVVLVRGVMALIGAVPLAIGAAIAAAVILLMQIPGVSEKIVSTLRAAFNALPAAVQAPMMAVYNIVKSVVLAVYKLFSYLNPFAHHSPSLVENVTNGMSIVRDQFATITSIHDPIMKAYADIKRFSAATYDLRQGLDKISRAQDLKELIKLAPGAVDEFKALVRDLQVLTPIMERLKQEVDDQQKVVDAWQKKLDNANKALDRQQERLQELSDVAENYNNLLSEAQADLDKFANAPIQGMRAMEDQIFANEMAQKRLRLEMMNLEDVAGPVDDLKDRLSKLAGQIDFLKGEQTDLRQAGAGSDVLGFYDEQIAALEQQQGAINSTASQYDALQAQLDALQRQGERLDLEKSLNFDGLTRAIDQAARGMEEMPFDQIMAGISGAKARIDEYGAALEAANTKVADQQKKVDEAQQRVDAINASYEKEKEQLDAISEKYDKVRDAVDAVNSALSDMISAVEEANRQGIKKKKGGGLEQSNALKNLEAAAGGTFPDVGGTSGLGREGGLPDIEAFIKQLEQDQADLAARIDLFKPLRDGVNKFKAWWNKNVVQGLSGLLDSAGSAFDSFGSNPSVTSAFSRISSIAESTFNFVVSVVEAFGKLFGDDIKDYFVVALDKGREAFQKIWPEIKKFGPVIKPMLDALKNIGIAIGIVATAIGIVLAPVIAAMIGVMKVMASVMVNVVGPVWTIIIDAISNFLQYLRGMMEFVTGVLTGDWALAWQGIKDIFGSMWDQMISIIKGVPAIIWAVIKGFVEGIRDFFVWLWDVLVGHSIIPDMINAIVDWFVGLPGKILSALASLGQKLLDLIQAAWNMLQSGLTSAWNNTWNFLKGLPQKMYDALTGALSLLQSAGTAILNAVWNGIKGVWSSVSDWVGEKIDWIVNKFTGIPGRMKNAFVGMFDGIKEAFKAAINWIIEKWNGLEWRIPEVDTHIPGIGKVGGASIGTPDIGYLAGGGVARAAQPYIVGEKGPEFFVPSVTGSVGTNNALETLLQKTIADAISTLQPIHLGDMAKGVSPATLAGIAGRADARVATADTMPVTVQSVQVNNKAEYHFHGDLSFPNIKSGDDAETFLTNLSDLAG